jgi:hypothetical protein
MGSGYQRRKMGVNQQILMRGRRFGPEALTGCVRLERRLNGEMAASEIMVEDWKAAYSHTWRSFVFCRVRRSR